MAHEPMITPYPWQQGSWQQLYRAMHENKLAHAILLGGAQGIGKLVLARCFAQALLCDRPSVTGACGQCRGCQLNRAETHPDLMQVSPEEKSKVIKIQQIRELTDFLANTAQQGGRKVVIIEPAEAMNINAANALLKNLEEPAGQTVLILVSHSPSYVMPTIRSRCQQLLLKLPDSHQSLSWLRPLCGQADPDQLMTFAGGAPLLARQLLEGETLDNLQRLERDLKLLLEHQISPLDAAANWQKLESLDVLGVVQRLLYQTLRSLHGGSDSALSELCSLLGNTRETVLHRLSDKLISLKAQLLAGSNLNKQLVLEELALDWSALTRAMPKSRQSLSNLLT